MLSHISGGRRNTRVNSLMDERLIVFETTLGPEEEDINKSAECLFFTV